jgi:hypothetical protein
MVTREHRCGSDGNHNSLDLAQVVALMNQERTNDHVYVSLLETRPTVFAGDKQMGGLPPSMMNAIQAGRSSAPLATAGETVSISTLIDSGDVVSGSVALRFKVK